MYVSTRTCACACARVCVRMCVCACVRVCVFAWLRVCRACVCVCSPTHFREVFDHNQILRMRRNLVKFAQDGGVPISALPKLKIEHQVVDDLLTKHRRNADAIISFGKFLVAKLESDKCVRHTHSEYSLPRLK